MSFEKFKKKDTPLVWAHRGASGYAPENTPEAFQLAIEQGADGIELDVQLTKEMGMEDKVLYSSFNHYTCVKLHELDPDCYVGFLYADGSIDVASYAKKHGANALHPALYNLQYPDYMQDAAKNDLDVNVWTVNEKEHMALACQYGVNAIITNYPDITRQVITCQG